MQNRHLTADMMILVVLFVAFHFSLGERTFTIDYENNCFLKDGKPFRYISGSIHYSRVPNFYWNDRLAKIRAAGLNAIEFYVAWNFHELQPGVFDFSGDANITHFLDVAVQNDLLVILRVGPFICGEWENGGLPWWLIKHKDIKMRTHDSRFLSAVQNWYAVLLPLLRPYLYKNGGPVILIAIENEYGSFSGCDVQYTTYLRDLVRKYYRYDTQLITVDGGSLGFLKCGFIPDVYPTVDFGVGNPQGAFAAQRTYAPRGPLVNSEFYPGWLDVWGKNFSRVSTGGILNTMAAMYHMNASFNFYMFFGGTNFGYWSGTVWGQSPVTTSYDYDAPISEAGDLTPKYFAIRKQIQNLTGEKPLEPPVNTTKKAYGSVELQLLGRLSAHLKTLSLPTGPIKSVYPKTFEDINFPYGYLFYETVLPKNGKLLSAPGLKDRGYVSVNDNFQGVLIYSFGGQKILKLNISAKAGQRLQILVENRGRQNMETINDFKGLTQNVSLDGVVLTNWTIHPINLTNLFKVVRSPRKRMKLLKYAKTKSKAKSDNFVPSIYYGKFSTDQLEDTFFDPTNWTKGQFLINGNNAGRYWPSMGPQVTLYTPKVFLRTVNHVILLELGGAGNCRNSNQQSCSVSFVDTPRLNKSVTQVSYETRLKLDAIEHVPEFVTT